MSLGSGFSPRRFLTEPPCAIAGSNETTGYARIRKSGRLLARSMGSVALAFPGVEMGPGGRRKVSAGREAHHADAIGGYAELLGARAHQANRPLRIAELDGVVIPWAQPVLEDEGGHSGRVEAGSRPAVPRDSTQAPGSRRPARR